MVVPYKSSSLGEMRKTLLTNLIKKRGALLSIQQVTNSNLVARHKLGTGEYMSGMVNFFLTGLLYKVRKDRNSPILHNGEVFLKVVRNMAKTFGTCFKS